MYTVQYYQGISCSGGQGDGEEGETRKPTAYRQETCIIDRGGGG
jgi:hypothetical protein